MTCFTDNPVADYERHAAKQEAALARLPKCNDCGQPIQEEHFYNIGGKNICVDCLDNNYRKWVEDYIECC